VTHSPADKYRRFRAPRQSGQALFDPAWADLPALVAANRRRADGDKQTIAGRAVSEVAAAARQTLLAEAHRFTRSFTAGGAQASDQAERPLIVSGHQPELFHPGVWLKNFALDALAQQTGGQGVHLLIDSDLCRGVSVRTPTGTIEAPHTEAIAYDKPAQDMAYEERRVCDPQLLATFGDRVAQALDGLIDRPLAQPMTADLVDAARATGNLGLALSRARRQIEGRWGGTTLELPFSTVCDDASFRWFASCLLADLPLLHQAYNESLQAYRLAHKLRSAAQPLPDLATDGDWREAPLWVWTTDAPARRALFAKFSSGKLQLTNRNGLTWTCDSPTGVADWLGELRRQGVKLRSRALVTTLYARLFLGDLFLHGIGGAKYDQVTDDFCHRLFGLAPPPHATLTATLQLPIEYPPPDPTEAAALKKQLRELRYHPENFIARPTTEVGRLLAEKHSVISVSQKHGVNAVRHQRIEHVNQALQPLLVDQQREIIARRDALAAELSAASALGSREFSFCLFPESFLRKQLCGLIEQA